MKRLAYSAIFILCATALHAQQGIPDAISVPGGSKLMMHVYARGVQIYSCVQDAKDTSLYVWAFQEPKADFYSDTKYSIKAGKHYLNADKNPTWELVDESVISATKLRQAPSPDASAIPWLLLSTVPQSDKGNLTSVAFIQRLYTKGGKAPATASRAQKGQVLQVPYTAEYFFYK